MRIQEILEKKDDELASEEKENIIKALKLKFKIYENKCDEVILQTKKNIHRLENNFHEGGIYIDSLIEDNLVIEDLKRQKEKAKELFDYYFGEAEK
jgi:tellurite resistance protein